MVLLSDWIIRIRSSSGFPKIFKGNGTFLNRGNWISQEDDKLKQREIVNYMEMCCEKNSALVVRYQFTNCFVAFSGLTRRFNAPKMN